MGNPATGLVLLGLFVLLLVHGAHRFRHTLYDGLQIKAQRTVAVLYDGPGRARPVATLVVLLSVADQRANQAALAGRGRGSSLSQGVSRGHRGGVRSRSAGRARSRLPWPRTGSTGSR